jgi:transcriptional regulator with XRE-family HTH domain
MWAHASVDGRAAGKIWVAALDGTPARGGGLAGQELGTTLRQWRLAARFTQRDLALRIGFHESAVASIERGERAPSAQYLDGVSAALHLEQARTELMWRLYRMDPGGGQDGGSGENGGNGGLPAERGAAMDRRRAAEIAEAELAESIGAASVGATGSAGGVAADDGGEEDPPYRGLLAFREEDADLYYGRETAVGLVTRKLDQGPMVAIVGAAGSGKSSAVFAGVVPQLRRDGAWDVVAFRPGGEPVRALVEALGGHGDELGAALPELARERVAEGRSLLVVADQFEELFTHGASGGEIAELLEALIAIAGAGIGADGGAGEGSDVAEGGGGEASKGADAGADSGANVASAATDLAGRIRVLVTFRGDFYGRMVAHRRFSDALQDHVVHLPPMELAELRQAIVEPARVSGLGLEEGLADRILEEAGAEPGVLPLLEFALTRLWETRTDPMLTHRGYERIGRLAGAISARAEEVYGALSPERQYTARQVLVRLVQVARPEEDGNDARRRTALAQLGGLPRVESVVQALADARLVVTDDAPGGPTVELAHEAIIRSWDRLRGWLVEDRQFLLWQQRARQWFEEWRLAGRQRAALLRGPILD